MAVALADAHPFGYGRNAYFWALIASMVVIGLMLTFVGPRQMWVLARVDEDDLSAGRSWR